MNPARALPDFEDHRRQQTRHTTCYMCACRCGIKVTLEDGRVRFIQGNPRHPVNRGVLCAKGNAGIMKQNSPAKLRAPLLRKKNAERGAAEFEEVSWETALDLLTERLARIRNEDPKKLAFYTGRDQMQAFTGLWAEQFGTLNWAAHGGFCSVNMAAAGLYTMGYSFWEFGEPDWERTKYFMLWGVAEDHSSNPIKLGLEKIKRRGARFVAINPVRTGYQAIADEWVPIIPGSDGMLALSMVHVLLSRQLVDRDFLRRYTNAPHLVADTPGGGGDGLLLRDAGGNALVWNAKTNAAAAAHGTEVDAAALSGAFTVDGRRARPVFDLISERYLAEEYAPARAEKICGVAAATIERLALEMAEVAFNQSIEVHTPWTDAAGRRHRSFTGRPVSMHAMRGISAHTNGFQTCRALHLLQSLLGALDCPGGFRAKAPYPRPVPPPGKPGCRARPGRPLDGPPLGFPMRPEDLAVDAAGKPLRLDKAYSWEAPLASHGMMHMAITNAVNGDPYPVDTLLLFMANMSWNSAMNTGRVREMLVEKDAGGEYKIPFVAVVDAFHSEMVNFADLVLPDTTYLERHDAISLLDRPISEPDAVCDSIRAPVLAPGRDVRPWQEVMLELAVRLKLPEFVDAGGGAKFRDYRDFITRYEKSPGIGFLAGWRGEDGAQHLRGAPNPKQWERYLEHECFFRHPLPAHMRFYRFANRDYLAFAEDAGFTTDRAPIAIQLYSEVLQTFRLAGRGLYPGPQPNNAADRARLAKYFDPLPFYYAPLDQARDSGGGGGGDGGEDFLFHAITQRPMMHYHSWDGQNPWLRQILAQNYLYMNRRRAEQLGIGDLSWVWLESRNGKIRVQIKHMEGVQPDTVWTWNAIGKQAGTGGLSADANEAVDGFLLNHLISELLPGDGEGRAYSNSDPVTGQAAWYDLRVRIRAAAPGEHGVWPRFPAAGKLPGMAGGGAGDVHYQTHAAVNIKRPWRDLLTRGHK